MSALETRRMWLPFSKIHGAKMTLIEKIRRVREVRGEEAFEDLAVFDVPWLLAALVTVAHDKQAVEVMTEALKMKLMRAGVI